MSRKQRSSEVGRTCVQEKLFVEPRGVYVRVSELLLERYCRLKCSALNTSNTDTRQSCVVEAVNVPREANPTAVSAAVCRMSVEFVAKWRGSQEGTRQCSPDRSIPGLHCMQRERDEHFTQATPHPSMLGVCPATACNRETRKTQPNPTAGAAQTTEKVVSSFRKSGDYEKCNYIL